MLLLELRRVTRARARFLEVTAGMLAPAWGRYAPDCALGSLFAAPAEYQVDFRAAASRREDFVQTVSTVLTRRFYQPESVRKYIGCLTRFLDWFYCSADRVRSRHIRSFLSQLEREGESRASLSLHLCALRTIFDRLCNCGVTRGLSFCEPLRRAPVQWTVAETGALFAAAARARDRLLIACFADIGRQRLQKRLRPVTVQPKTVPERTGAARDYRIQTIPANNEFAGFDCGPCTGQFHSLRVCQTQRETQVFMLCPRVVERLGPHRFRTFVQVVAQQLSSVHVPANTPSADKRRRPRKPHRFGLSPTPSYSTLSDSTWKPVVRLPSAAGTTRLWAIVPQSRQEAYHEHRRA